jgi:hypothetical protein
MRPNGADHDDPTFSAALEETHADPELRAWFEREQAVDRALVAKLREVRAPAELRAQILQGVALSSAAPARQLRRPILLAVAALAAAASIALLIYTVLPAARPQLPSFDLMVAAAVRESVNPPALTPNTASADDAAAWIRQSNLPAPGILPGMLGEKEVLGAAAAQWQGVQCSLITLRAPELVAGSGHDGHDPTLVHIYTISRNSCSSAGLGRTPRIATRDGATIATWRDAERNYVLVTRGSPAGLQALLGPDAQVAQVAVTRQPPVS